MSPLRKILSSLLLFISAAASAQVNIGISSVQGFLNQLTDGQVVSYTVTVHNYGPGPLTGGNLLLYTAVDTFGNGFNTVTTDSSYFNLNTLPQDSEKVYSITTQYTTGGGSAYKTGGNVIVIWPQAIGANNVQSFTDTVYISPPVGPSALGELRFDKKKLVAWPNPSKEQVLLSVTEPGLSIEQVRIYTLDGHEAGCERQGNAISLEALPVGTYLVTVTLSNGQQKSIRIVRD